jgi:hypothetical protein
MQQGEAEGEGRRHEGFAAFRVRTKHDCLPVWTGKHKRTTAKEQEQIQTKDQDARGIRRAPARNGTSTARTAWLSARAPAVNEGQRRLTSHARCPDRKADTKKGSYQYNARGRRKLDLAYVVLQPLPTPAQQQPLPQSQANTSLLLALLLSVNVGDLEGCGGNSSQFRTRNGESKETDWEEGTGEASQPCRRRRGRRCTGSGSSGS